MQSIDWALWLRVLFRVCHLNLSTILSLFLSLANCKDGCSEDFIHGCLFLHLPHLSTSQIRSNAVYLYRTSREWSLLVDLLSVERNTEGAEKQSAVSVVCGGSVDSNVETRNHLGRVPIFF